MCILLIVIKRNNKHINPSQLVIPGTNVPGVEIHVHALFSKSKYPIKRDKIFFPTKPFSQFFCGFSADCPSSEELQTNVHAARLHTDGAGESESQRFRSDWLVFFFLF